MAGKAARMFVALDDRAEALDCDRVCMYKEKNDRSRCEHG